MSSSSSSSQSDSHISWSEDGRRFDIRLHGHVTLTDDLTDVQTMSDGGSLTLRDWTTMIPHTVEITASNGTLIHTYYVGGIKKPWDDEAKRFLATQLPLVVRRTGLGAEERVKSIFAKKGAAGVFDEIDQLGGDYARRLYLIALVDVARFDSTTVQPLLQRTGRIVTSDYERRQVLEHVASHVALDHRAAMAYVEAMATMKSDYDQREALTALTRKHPAALDGDVLAPVMAHMKSSYDKRMVLEDMIAHATMSADAKRTALAAIAEMSSDYDRREVLSAYITRFGLEPALREPFFAAVRTIKSNYDRREVLTGLAKKGATPSEVQTAVFESVGQMTSDYDRAEVLLAYARSVDAASRPAYVSAAQRLTSTYDQNRVLAALAKAETR